VFEVAAVEDQYSVEQFATDGADPAFGDRVRLGRRRWGAQDADALAGEHGIEGRGEFGVAVPDQKREARRAVAEVGQEVPCLLGDPGAGGVGGDAEEVDAAGGVFYDNST
jgi:hypothetical protein